MHVLQKGRTRYERIFVARVLAGGVVSGGVQQKVPTNSEVMKTNTSTIRLVYPQWQGGNVAAMVPEVELSLIHI